jgi:hypothetical protein
LLHGISISSSHAIRNERDRMKRPLKTLLFPAIPVAVLTMTAANADAAINVLDPAKKVIRVTYTITYREAGQTSAVCPPDGYRLASSEIKVVKAPKGRNLKAQTTVEATTDKIKQDSEGTYLFSCSTEHEPFFITIMQCTTTACNGCCYTPPLMPDIRPRRLDLCVHALGRGVTDRLWPLVSWRSRTTLSEVADGSTR